MTATVSADATFAVGGMTCASCSAIIEKVLGKTAGIHSAVVNLATEKLNVTYDPAVIDTDGIISAVERHRLHGDAARYTGHGGGGPGQGHARTHRHDVRVVRRRHREDAHEGAGRLGGHGEPRREHRHRRVRPRRSSASMSSSPPCAAPATTPSSRWSMCPARAMTRSTCRPRRRPRRTSTSSSCSGSRSPSRFRCSSSR